MHKVFLFLPYGVFKPGRSVSSFALVRRSVPPPFVILVFICCCHSYTAGKSNKSRVSQQKDMY